MTADIAVNAVSSGLSNATHFNNPAPNDGDYAEVNSLSEVAKQILNSVTDLQKGFEGDVVKSSEDTGQINKLTEDTMSKPAGPDQVNDSMKVLTDQIAQSTQVQEQLTRFVMASSVSSSLGRNLNMFLRGQ